MNDKVGCHTVKGKALQEFISYGKYETLGFC